MSEFTLPLSERDQDWIKLRERFGRAAREMLSEAASNEAVDAAALLRVAGILARLAISIPRCPTKVSSVGPVDASTLLAAQVLQGRSQFDGVTSVRERPAGR
jgi:hypothetical protein